MLRINADDWGLNKKATDSTLTCFKNNRVNSASAMMFMEDSQRSSELALENKLDIGLHLNLTIPFTGDNIPTKLNTYHNQVVSFLTQSNYSRILYNPVLNHKIAYCFKKQWSEFERLYGKSPLRMDGHHHIHLCSNLLFSNILPPGITVRPNFFFKKGQKSYPNRLYRKMVDFFLKKKFKCVSYLYKLPVNASDTWFQEIVEQSKHRDVELEVHPEIQMEYEFLMSSRFMALISSD